MKNRLSVALLYIALATTKRTYVAVWVTKLAANPYQPITGSRVDLATAVLPVIVTNSVISICDKNH